MGFVDKTKKKENNYWNNISAGSTFDSINSDQLKNVIIYLPKNNLEQERRPPLNKSESKYFSTAARMDEAFLELIETKDFSYITVKEICEKAGVPLQYFANRSDEAGGSTLGNIAMTQVSMNTVDIGLPQLAMHSAYETAGVKDTEYMVKAVETFYASHIQADSDGNYQINQ